MGVLKADLRSWTKVTLVGLSIFILGAFLDCVGSEKEPEGISDAPAANYDNWKQYSYQRVRLLYPPDHPHADKMYNLTRGYISAIKRDCNLLEIPTPTDTLIVYHYTGYGQGREMTGRPYPFVVGDTIHFWMPAPLGATLMQWLLPRWIAKEPRYQFLKNGLISLVDDSKRDYHDIVQRYVDSAVFIPLTDLAVDTAMDIDKERYQSGEGASFIDFMLYTYGMPALHALYLAESSFDITVQGLFKISADSLETEWLDYVYRVNRGEIPPRKQMPWSVQPDESGGQ
ncbi:MAG: hypothetical protein ABIE70_05705 [bacterium]